MTACPNPFKLISHKLDLNVQMINRLVKTLFLALWLGGLSLAGAQAQTPAAAAACPALLNHTMPRLQDEKPQSLCQYTGKVLLVVNTASYCGFTPQYKGLEALYAKYKDQGLVVLGFPSNDFAQEKSNNKDIADFCDNTFGVKFPMFAASSVKGDQANPLFKQLAAQGATAPRWNFYKYLIGRDGKLVDNYSSMTAPDSKGLVSAIEKSLGAKP
jgi:glutathione peroxidase